MTESKEAPRAEPGSVEDRLRVTSLAGTAASIAIVVAFFLPWVVVPKAEAERYRDQIQTRLEEPIQPLPPGVPRADWQRLADLVAKQGHVSGLDVFYWARTATATADAYGRTGPGDETPRTGPLPRAIGILTVVVAAVPVGALLLALYFLLVSFRRAHSPALVIAVLDGAVAVGLLATYGIVRVGIGVANTPGLGLEVTGVAGAVLFLAGVFGVRLKNWWRVFLGAMLLGGILALIVWGTFQA